VVVLQTRTRRQTKSVGLGKGVGGTVDDERVASPDARIPVPRTRVRAAVLAPAPASQGASSLDTRDVRISNRIRQPIGSQETAAASSQSVVAVEDDGGVVWDSYRLASSPGRAKVVQSGPAYRDDASGRLRVARSMVAVDNPHEEDESVQESIWVSGPNPVRAR
jgi:hypothetical protein